MKARTSIFISSILLVLALAMFSCTQKSADTGKKAGVEYYRGLLFSETPYDTETGTHPLTAEEAKDINNYTFTYDDAGRLLSVEYVRGEQLLSYGSLAGAAKITYTYEGNKQIKHYFNDADSAITSGGVFTAEYTLDENGNRTGLKFFDKDGNPVENRNKIHSWVWTKLPDGMIRELRYNLDNEETVMNEFCPFYELRFSYNEKGHVTRMANYQGDTLYNCTAENCGDIGVSYFTFESNEHGDLEKFTVYNVSGQMANLYWGWAKRISKYDENGYVTETAQFDQDDEYLGGKNVPVVQYKRDSHGAVVESVNMDKDRNIINHPETGVAITEYKYNEKGQRTETIRYDKDRVVITQ